MVSTNGKSNPIDPPQVCFVTEWDIDVDLLSSEAHSQWFSGRQVNITQDGENGVKHISGSAAVYSVVSHYLHALSHKHPDLEFLEIGTVWEGGSTCSPILQRLRDHSDEGPRFSRYEVSEVAVSGQQLTTHQPAYTSRMTNAKYDIVILDTTSSLAPQSGKSSCPLFMKTLLKSRGKLLMVIEVASQEDCIKQLEDAGFFNIKTIQPHGDPLHTLAIAEVTDQATESQPQPAIILASETLVILPSHASAAADLAVHKISQTFKQPVQTACIGGSASMMIPDTTGKTCIFLTEIETPILATIDEPTFYAVRQAIIQANYVLWVTRGGSTIRRSSMTVPESNLATGLGRTLRSEKPANRFVTLDVDSTSDAEETAAAVTKLFSSTLLLSSSSSQFSDSEYALHKGQIHIPRFVPDKQINSFVAREILGGGGQPQPPTTTTIRPHHETKLSLDKRASYLLIGGLGGLGRSLGSWMASQGARNLIFLSRSGTEGSQEAQEAVAALNSLPGVKVFVYKCDVGDWENLEEMLRRCREDDGVPPIKGVIHGGMVLRNSTFKKMTHEQWSQTLHPKVRGTQNLCRAFSSSPHPLDFFIILSSSVGIIGMFGQSNYAASSTFQDAIATAHHHHHHHHFSSTSSSSPSLPIVTLDLGMILGAGYVAENSAAAATLEKLGIVGISQEQFLSIVKAVILLDGGRTREQQQHQIMIGLGTKGMVNNPATTTTTDAAKDEYKIPYYFQDAKFSHLREADRRRRSMSSA